MKNKIIYVCQNIDYSQGRYIVDYIIDSPSGLQHKYYKNYKAEKAIKFYNSLKSKL